MSEPADDTFNAIKEIAVQAPSTPMAPAHGIAAIALNMALKYHDINTVQDGVLYQQYKMEGKNLHALHLDHVFETAIRMEMHLLAASDRIAKVVVEAIAGLPPDDEEKSEDTAAPSGSGV